MPETAESPHGSIQFITRKGSARALNLVGNTVGRVGSLPTNLLFGVPKESFRSPDEKLAEELQESVKDVQWQGNYEVYLGHSPLLRQLKRLFSSDRRTNFFVRMGLGIPATVGAWTYGQLTRSSAYNAYTESAQIYHKDKGVALHELGHAHDFDKATHPTLHALSYNLPFFINQLEWNASHNAMKFLKTDEEREKTRKVLEPAWGSYLGAIPGAGILNRIFLPGVLGGIALGHLHARFGKKNIFYSEKDQVTPNNTAEESEKKGQPIQLLQKRQEVPIQLHETKAA